MNSILEQLITSKDFVSKKTLALIGGYGAVAYTTEYLMNSKLGPLKFWITWKEPTYPDKEKWQEASIFIHDARARLYFPAYLDTRIPPENREGIKGILDSFNMDEYDKFELVVRSGGKSPIKFGYVVRLPARDCEFDEIHAIDEVLEEYFRKLEV